VTVEVLTKVLQVAGFDLRPEDLLDALWLGSLGRDLTCYDLAPGDKPNLPGSGGDAERDQSAGDPKGIGGSSAVAADEEPQDRPEPTPRTGPKAPVYDAGEVTAEDTTLPAVSIILPSARTLPDRLALVRALRPFRREYHSLDLELDEARTAELTAEMRAGTGGGVFPVLRPCQERWFEAHIVVEDDPAIDLWAAPLREFGDLLRHVGAFRLVRTWRLRLDPSSPQDLVRARLASPAGGLSSLGSLGTSRQLIFFASHGLSARWTDGTYAGLLASWTASSIVLLHLQPRRRWSQTALGEPHALARSLQPGSSNRALELETFWWRPGPDVEDGQAIGLPAITLEPAALETWARTLMGLGRQTETFLLAPGTTHADHPAETRALDEPNLQRALTTLQERSPAAYDLAMMLANAPFTLPVARLVQEVMHGGDSDFTVLAELMLSGIVAARCADDTVARDTTYYVVREEFRPLLLQSLRGSDADGLANALDERISKHLSDTAGRSIHFAALIAHPDGQAKLPTWAQEFAHITVALGNRLTSAQREDEWENILDALDDSVIGGMARLARADFALSAETIVEWLWHHLDDPRLTRLEPSLELKFQPLVAAHLRSRLAEQPYLGLEILWVDDNPENNDHIGSRLAAGGASVALALDTEDAAGDPRLAQYDLVISDMERRGNRRAGYDLMRQLRARHVSAPVLIFAGYTMSSPTRRRAVMEAGAFGGTNDERELLALLDEAALVSTLRPDSPSRKSIEAQALNALPLAKRDIAHIAEGEFCSLEEVYQTLGESHALAPYERIVGSLRFFETQRQQSWLIATTRQLLFALDDPLTRSERRLVQRRSPLSDGSKVSARVDVKNTHLLQVGSDSQPWYYSPSLFESPGALETEVRDLVRKAIEASKAETRSSADGAHVTTTKPGEHELVQTALRRIDIDCDDAVVLEILLEAARLSPAAGYEHSISLSRIFCGALTVAGRLPDPEARPEVQLRAFEATLRSARWSSLAKRLTENFVRDDLEKSRRRLELGFSDSASSALRLAARRGGISATAIINVILNPEPGHEESMLYQTLTNLPALRADVEKQVASEATRRRNGDTPASLRTVTRSFNAEIRRELGYATGFPLMPTIALGTVGILDDGAFTPETSLNALTKSQFIETRESPVSNMMYRSAHGIEIAPSAGGVTVNFSKRHAILMHLTGCRLGSYADPENLATTVLALYRERLWNKDWHIVTEVLEAQRSTILVAGRDDAVAFFAQRSEPGNSKQSPWISVDPSNFLLQSTLTERDGIAFEMNKTNSLTPLFRLGKIKTSLLREPRFLFSE